MQLIREQSNASVQLSRTGGNVGKGTAGHADRTGLRQPEGQETQVFHEALLQGQRLHAEVPFDEQIKASASFVMQKHIRETLFSWNDYCIPRQ